MAKPAPDLLKTQNPQTVHIDLQGRTATCSFQWLLEKSQSHPIRTGNTLQAFIGGQEGFAAIAADIEAACESIDLVCWGFDPGMALVRKQCLTAYPWANGEPYGELLRRKAAQGVKVRLLVWYNPKGSAKQNSLVGYVNTAEFLVGGVINRTSQEMLSTTQTMAAGAMCYPSFAGPAKVTSSVQEQRQDYCTKWWREATSGQIPNLEVRCRDGISAKVKSSVADEADKPQATASTHGGLVSEQMLIEDNATHHQKPILIDYAHEDGSHAVGYIMGLNSVSDYWDTLKHQADDPARETDHEGKSDDAAKAAAKRGQPISRKPLQDYALRIEGAALVDVNKNFCAAWNRAQLLPKLAAASNARHQAVRSADLNASLQPKRLAKTGKDAQALRLQVLRTQPEEGYTDAEKAWAFDKSIKHAYFQATSFARNYIYLENQYFFYEEWARHLKANRQAFMEWTQAAGKASKDARLLHLLAVIPKPEDDGMVPRTYDTFKSLGQANAMPGQKAMYDAQEKAHADQQVWDERYNALPPDKKRSAWQVLGPRPVGGLGTVAQDAHKVKEPSLNKEGVLMQDGKSLGLKVLVCNMVAPNQSGNKALGVARDIYIHSKLLMVDDCFMTLGSANLNLRSMSADSEINVATDSIAHTRALRQRVWGMQTDGQFDGGVGTPKSDEMVEIFENWKKLAKANAEAILQKNAAKIQGHLAQFEDKRVAFHRYG
ncbi:phospholipase D-like domain-containing protein [Limnohabitans sp. DM1]|uniref:phospholipase D-like domain-containing protein n=1 Tax=Limnohabitans sp. DM1 TaxID=1597955 RepID=UPI000A78AD4A|nr:phospholipase D-like domain-containing protein [Limnohabitans sp. DM1]